MKNLYIPIFIIFTFLVSSCEKKEDAKTLSGELIGFVNLIDKAGNNPIDKSGVNINIKNHSYSTTTNSIGRYNFKNLSSGSYTIEISKDGYGMLTIPYQFLGGNVPSVINKSNLFKYDSVQFTNIEASLSLEDNRLTISGNITNPGAYTYQIFLNDSANVSLHNYDQSSYLYSSITADNGEFIDYINFPPPPSFKKGDNLYFVIYSINNYDDWPSNFDLINEKRTYSSLKKASEVYPLIAR